MQKINLRDYYPFLKNDYIIEVPKEISTALMEMKRQEQNAIRRIYWNKAHYSLDIISGTKKDVVKTTPTPTDVYEQKLQTDLIYSALHSLTTTQYRRVYAYFFLGFSQTEIAQLEGVSLASVNVSVRKGLHKMKKYLIKNEREGLLSEHYSHDR